jgi:peptidoglycan/LPS O-acetylase OafA/YrhL
LGIVDTKFSAISPLSKIIYSGGNYSAFLIGMFPISADDNVTGYFHLPNYRLIGEWFIGTIVWLYIISPLLYKCLKKNLLLTLTISIGIADSIFKFAQVPSILTFFIVRIPEFSFGMVLFLLKDFIEKNNILLTKIMAVLGAILIAYGLYFGSATKNIFEKIIFGAPFNIFQYLFAAAITVYFSYYIVTYLNENFSGIMMKFNAFSNISYVAMLIHHFVIYRLNDIYHFSNSSKFGVAVFFVMVLFFTIFFSEQIHKIYKPLEEKLIKRRGFFD